MPDVKSPGEPAAEAAPLPPSRLAVLLDAANKQIGVPYRFDGESPKGFDCSGFTSFVFRKAKMELPRTADQQSRAGAWIALDEVLPGDLLFFSDQSGGPAISGQRMTHVGLVISGPDEPLAMIHASTSSGVIRTEVTKSRYWRERLRFARRPSAR